MRAVAPPYPGAFTTTVGGDTARVLRTCVADQRSPTLAPTLAIVDGRLFAHCGDGGSLRVLELELGGGRPTQPRCASASARRRCRSEAPPDADRGLRPERDRPHSPTRGNADFEHTKATMKKVLILGVNGFIGHHLSQRILATTDWEVYGMDMQTERITDLMGDTRFHFFEGDITINKEWIEYHVKKCDVILPLVAIATPATYVKRAAARVRARLRGQPADRAPAA